MTENSPSALPLERLFVSHATADRELVEGFVRFLESGVGVPAGSIFCSSMPGSKIPSGKNFRDAIQREASRSVYIIALISPAFMKSSFCWSELGAGWVLGERLKPFAIGTVDYSDITNTVIGDLQCLKFTDGDLCQFRDELAQLSPKWVPTDRWEQEKTHFLRNYTAWAQEARTTPAIALPPGLAGKIILHVEKPIVFGTRALKTEISWKDVFFTVAKFIEFRNERAIRSGLLGAVVEGANSVSKITDPNWTEITLKLHMEELVVSRKSRDGQANFWSLTPKGRALYCSLDSE